MRATELARSCFRPSLGGRFDRARFASVALRSTTDDARSWLIVIACPAGWGGTAEGPSVDRNATAKPHGVVCVKFSKLVMVRVGWFIQVTRAASLCSIGNDHPFVPTCPSAERRAQRQSRMPPRTRRHRRSRRAASLTERARCYACPGGTAPRQCPAGLLPLFFRLLI